MVVNNLERNNNKQNKVNNNDTNYDEDHNNEKKRKKTENEPGITKRVNLYSKEKIILIS